MLVASLGQQMYYKFNNSLNGTLKKESHSFRVLLPLGGTWGDKMEYQ